MRYESAQDLYDYLATTIDDHEWIVKAVRIQFPAFMKPPKAYNQASRNASKTEVIRSPRNAHKQANPDPKIAYSKPMDRQEGWYDSEITDQIIRRAFRNGSERLLAALHQEHPTIMQALKDRGNNVATPMIGLSHA